MALRWGSPSTETPIECNWSTVGEGSSLEITMLAINAVSRGESAVVVATQMTNFGTERYLTEQGISLYRTRVGDRHVFEALRERELLLGG